MDKFLTTPNWLNSNFLFAVLFGPLPCFVYSASFLLRGELLSSYWSWGVAIYNLATFLFGKHSIYLVVFHKLYQGGELGWDCLQMIMVIVEIFFPSYLLTCRSVFRWSFNVFAWCNFSDSSAILWTISCSAERSGLGYQTRMEPGTQQYKGLRLRGNFHWKLLAQENNKYSAQNLSIFIKMIQIQGLISAKLSFTFHSKWNSFWA